MTINFHNSGLPYVDFVLLTNPEEGFSMSKAGILDLTRLGAHGRLG